jgi:hypothetical protein
VSSDVRAIDFGRLTPQMARSRNQPPAKPDWGPRKIARYKSAFESALGIESPNGASSKWGHGETASPHGGEALFAEGDFLQRLEAVLRLD